MQHYQNTHFRFEICFNYANGILLPPLETNYAKRKFIHFPEDFDVKTVFRFFCFLSRCINYSLIHHRYILLLNRVAFVVKWFWWWRMEIDFSIIVHVYGYTSFIIAKNGMYIWYFMISPRNIHYFEFRCVKCIFAKPY